MWNSGLGADMGGKIPNQEFGITVVMAGLFIVEKMGFRKYYEKRGSKFFSGRYHESYSDVLGW